MPQVLPREEETILDLHITGTVKTASNTGDLQRNQAPGTHIEGTLLWGSPTVPTVSKSKTSPSLGDAERSSLFTCTKNTGSTNKGDGAGKMGIWGAPPGSNEPQLFAESSRG